MGRRQRGPGTRRAIKNRDLGIPPELVKAGFDKHTLDLMNEESKRQFNLGVGVLVQERERAEQLLKSFDHERWWQKLVPARVFAFRRARSDYHFWHGRLAAVSKAVADARFG